MPNKIFKVLKTDHFGSMRVKFSHGGRFLAYTVTLQNDISFVKVFDLENDQDFCSIYLHNNLIHQIEWSRCDRFLLTASADFTMKVFKLPENKVFDVKSLKTMGKY